jgi:hypothetical protein
VCLFVRAVRSSGSDDSGGSLSWGRVDHHVATARSGASPHSWGSKVGGFS